MSPLRIAPVIFTLGLLGSVHALEPDPSRSSTEQQLVQQLRHAETVYRDDLLDDTAERLRRLDPGAPEALFAKVYLAVRQGRLDVARDWLEQLEASQPVNNEYVLRAQKWLELASADNQAVLAEARLLAAVGRVEEARDAYDGILQGVLPTADLAFEYWQVRGRLAAEADTSFAEMQSWLSRYPRHPALLIAVANGYFSRDQPERAIELLRQLGRIPDRREEAASRELDYLRSLPTTEATAAQFQDFLTAYPESSVANQAQSRWQHHRQLLDDPVWRSAQAALRQLDQGGQVALAPLQRAVRAYPDNAEFMGALGLAYLRSGDRAAALTWFEKARANTERVDQASAWVSLIESTRYWMLLERAAAAFADHDLARAQQLYAQAHRQNPTNLFALIGLGDVAWAQGDSDTSWRYYHQAFRIAPAEGMSQRTVERYLLALPPLEALAIFYEFSPAQQAHLSNLHQRLRVAHLEQQADEALAAQNWSEAARLLAEAQSFDLDNPWLSYRLAVVLRQDGRTHEGVRAFERHLERHPNRLESRYAHALLLESAEAWPEGRQSLRHIPLEEWSDAMQVLDQRLADRLHIAEATRRAELGSPEQGIAYLERVKSTPLIQAQLADWYLLQGRPQQALLAYQAILQEVPADHSATLGVLEARLALGESQAVLEELRSTPPTVPAEDIPARRRLGMIWAEAGDTQQGTHVLQAAAADATGPQPWLYRDLGRLTAATEPQTALSWYARGLQDSGVLAVASPDPVDNLAFTRALRTPDGEQDWLTRSLRSDATELYQQRNPSLTLATDYWHRRDGTPGLSELNASTTIAQLEYPIAQGRGFVRAEHVYLNAGTFETNPAGDIATNVGSCQFAGFDSAGILQALPGCAPTGSTKAKGQMFALGWEGERFAFDVGRTPSNFLVSNWVGGVRLAGDLGTWGWRLRLSRRPVASSVLSYAGMRDPRTGTVWGGVLATGGGVSLSWDQGERDGIWLNFDHHRLTGENVADNHRTRLMGGYYRRLILAPNEELSVGVNLMHWRYRQDLSDYTLGHGGYYSPQRYTSLSLPVSYARRTANWSYAIRGAVSHAWTRTSATDAYPLLDAVASPLQNLQAMGVSIDGFLAANRTTGGSSSSWGYSLQAAVERRLTPRWVAGLNFDLQHGEDFAPSRFMLYLRYSFSPWLGDLRLPPQGPNLYVDFD